ncbi:MAG: hypothetical protein K2Z81_25305, partial [Cyanobacteria bacterium]|nr:hypothetical protein [Cyanobacteriota bacterium]
IVSAGGADSVTEAYNKFFNRQSPCETTIRIERNCVSSAEAVRGIIDAGGVASLAHPAYSPIPDSELHSILSELSNEGLAAMEVFHPAHSREEIVRLEKFSRHYGLLPTGGSDCHGPFEEHLSLIGTIEIPGNTVLELKEIHAGRRREKNFGTNHFSP